MYIHNTHNVLCVIGIILLKSCTCNNVPTEGSGAPDSIVLDARDAGSSECAVNSCSSR